jgi:hypothetical protein
MPGLTDGAANALLDWYWGGDALTQLTTAYIGLFSTQPDSAGASGVELAGTGYARKVMLSSDWAAAANRAIANAASVEFNVAAGSAWGTAIGFGMFTAASGGTARWLGVFVTPYVIGLGTPVIFAPGLLQLRFPA